MFLLHFLRWLRTHAEVSFEVLLAKGGPLADEFAKVARVHQAAEVTERPGLVAGFDLIYANTICCTDLIDALPLGGVPVVTHVHELDSGYEWVGARRIAAAVRHTGHFIACARIVAERLQARFAIPETDITVHHEMIAPALLPAAMSPEKIAAARAARGIPAEALVLVGCGTADFRKGAELFPLLVQSVKRRLGGARPVRGVWVGAASVPHLWQMIHHDMRKLGLEEEVRFTGELAAPENELALADVQCLLSREDPFPLTMLEAAAQGRPLVCFAGSGGADEFGALGGAITVPYLDLEAMAAACCELGTDPSHRERRVRQAAAVVRENFTVDCIAPALWATVQAQLATLPSGAPLEAARAIDVTDIYARWSAAEQAQHPAVQAGIVRRRAFAEARQLARQGRRGEAAQRIVKAVNVDMACKDGFIICESLLEAAEVLAPLDAKQAAALRENAVSMARNARISPELFRSRKPAAA